MIGEPGSAANGSDEPTGAAPTGPRQTAETGGARGAEPRHSKAVRNGMQRYLAARISGDSAGTSTEEGAPEEEAVNLPMPGEIRPLERRSRPVRSMRPMAQVPRRRSVPFRAGGFRTTWRLVVWVFAAIRLALGTLGDILVRKDSIDRRAVRLRHVLQGMGPTFVKLGQQLSIRADILPYRYCAELTKLLDSVPPFPVERAIERVEAVAKRPIEEIFLAFDPKPIGSASIGCVYQAVLPTGERVAVKVRRPGIGDTFASDLRAMGWLLTCLEELTLLRPGMTADLRAELRKMLFEELDYPLEARYTELFSSRAKKKKQTFIGAPKVYFELCGEDVIVTEFISGVFLWEVLSALDSKDPTALNELRALGYDPELIAKRMIRAFYWETLENIFFHADPHPANIVVRPDNTLVFIDFGSCGRFSGKTKRAYHRFQHYITEEDVSGMTEAAMTLLEPLPPIDLEKLTREIEAFFWDWLYATKSAHAEWWERCTGQMWMKFLSIARRYAIPINLDTLRMFRATFLYDSIAFRLHKDLDMNGEFKEYVRERGSRTRKKVRRALRRRVEKGLDDRDYIVMQRLARLGRQFINRVQHELDSPHHRFFDMLGKAAYGVSMLLRVAMFGSGLHVVVLFGIGAYLYSRGTPAAPSELLRMLVSSTAYQVGAGVLVLFVARKALARLSDMDVERG
jgi:ubiquinone biosynthesis protein